MMMKNRKIISLVVFCLLFLGCSKDHVTIFSAKFHNYHNRDVSKVHLTTETTPVWDADDEIMVNNVLGIVTSDNQISVQDLPDNDDGYGMFYPADFCRSIAPNMGTVILPPIQEYQLTGSQQKILAPMAAKARTGNVIFSNLCGLVCLNLTNQIGSSITITRIEMSSPTETLSGKFNFHFSSTSPYEPTSWQVRTDYASNSNTVTLDCSDANVSIENGGSKSFYLFVPPFSNSQISFKIYVDGSDGYEYLLYQTSSSGVSISASQLIVVPFTLTSSSVEKTGLLIGDFTINSRGEKVRFSMGNLEYTSTYSFGVSQYEGVTSENYFGWGSGSYPSRDDAEDNLYGPVVSTTTLQDWDINSEYEWGFYPISNSHLVGWFTLSKQEWNYLLTQRGNLMFAYCKVGSTRGLLLFPDGFRNEDFPNGINIEIVNDLCSSWQRITQQQFDQLQKLGVVFLPFGGYRVNQSGIQANYMGYYWSRSSKSTSEGENSTTAWCEQFNYLERPSGTNLARHMGACVRLVRKK